MRIYWLNGALTIEPESKKENDALTVLRKSLMTVACDDGIVVDPSVPKEQDSNDNENIN